MGSRVCKGKCSWSIHFPNECGMVSRKDSVVVNGTLKSQPPRCHVGCHEPEQWWQGVPSRENPTQPSWGAGSRSAALLLPVPISCCAQGEWDSEAGKHCHRWGVLGVCRQGLYLSSPVLPSPCASLCAEVGCCWCLCAPAWQLPGISWGCTPKLGAPAATTVLTFDCLPLLPSFARVIIMLSMKSWAC